MKKLIRFGLPVLILVVLVSTWGDNFSSRDQESIYYLRNYRQVKENYLKEGSRYLDRQGLDYYQLNVSASKLKDYEFLIKTLQEDSLDNPSSRETLLEALLRTEAYDEAEALAREFLEEDRALNIKSARPRLGRKSQLAYKSLIEVYSQTKNQEAMDQLYYEISRETSLIEDLKSLGEDLDQGAYDYLEKIIETSQNPAIKKEILDIIIGQTKFLKDMFFIGDQAGYKSEEMEKSITRARKLVAEDPDEYRELAIFLEVYPSLASGVFIDYQDRILIMEEANFYEISYLDPYAQEKILWKERIKLPNSYKIFQSDGLVTNQHTSFLTLDYDYGYMLLEFTDRGSIETRLELDYSLEGDGDLDFFQATSSKELYLENDRIYECFTLRDRDGKLARAFLREFRLSPGGYLEEINPERIY